MASGDAEITLVAGELRLTAPYDAEFIAELKRLIPYRERRWDADDKVWVIHKMFRRQVIDLCEEHFDHVDVDDATKAVARTPSQSKAPSPDEITVAYAMLIRFVTDNALEQIYAVATADRRHINDTSVLTQMTAAYAVVIAHRDRTERTG